MNIPVTGKTLGWLAGIIISIGVILGGISAAADKFVQWHDDRWITIAGLEKIFSDRDLKDLKDRIKEYEWIRDKGDGLTDKQEWELGEMYDDLEEATTE